MLGWHEPRRRQRNTLRPSAWRTLSSRLGGRAAARPPAHMLHLAQERVAGLLQLLQPPFNVVVEPAGEPCKHSRPLLWKVRLPGRAFSCGWWLHYRCMQPLPQLQAHGPAPCRCRPPAPCTMCGCPGRPLPPHTWCSSAKLRRAHGRGKGSRQHAGLGRCRRRAGAAALRGPQRRLWQLLDHAVSLQQALQLLQRGRRLRHARVVCIGGRRCRLAACCICALWGAGGQHDGGPGGLHPSCCCDGSNSPAAAWHAQAWQGGLARGCALACKVNHLD
jgi:hypothetical protein